jgi:hypothetical protein
MQHYYRPIQIKIAVTMKQAINWQTHGDTSADTPLIHYAQCHDPQDAAVQSFINSAIDRAIAIIPQSMHENARYLLFNWDGNKACLTAVTTDDNKSHDAPESIQLDIPAWQVSAGSVSTEQSDTLHYWIRDYLTTCAEFLHYSLIAVYCEGDRSNTRLL